MIQLIDDVFIPLCPVSAAGRQDGATRKCFGHLVVASSKVSVMKPLGNTLGKASGILALLVVVIAAILTYFDDDTDPVKYTR